MTNEPNTNVPERVCQRGVDGSEGCGHDEGVSIHGCCMARGCFHRCDFSPAPQDCICHQGQRCERDDCDLYHHKDCVVQRDYHVAAPPIGDGTHEPRHVLLTKENCGWLHAPTTQCPVCEGGLAVCAYCGHYETELTDDPVCHAKGHPARPTEPQRRTSVPPRCEFTCHDPSYKSLCGTAHRCKLPAGHSVRQECLESGGHDTEDFEGHEPPQCRTNSEYCRCGERGEHVCDPEKCIDPACSLGATMVGWPHDKSECTSNSVPEPPAISELGAFWVQWFKDVGAHGTMDVIHATTKLVIAEREIAVRDRVELIRKAVEKCENIGLPNKNVVLIDRSDYEALVALVKENHDEK